MTMSLHVCSESREIEGLSDHSVARLIDLQPSSSFRGGIEKLRSFNFEGGGKKKKKSFNFGSDGKPQVFHISASRK